ncbi:MAG: pitrilysin family protein [Candidatus Latescibacter sp.]|nr:pitrilysin family protein [Candidatus Latescibacter sp.]
MKRVCMMFAAFFFLLGLVTQAAMADKPLELKFEKYTLANGMDVIMHEDHSIPVVAVNVMYHVGCKNEKMGRTGLAHLVEHMMFQGSEHYDGEYFAPFEKIGGSAGGGIMRDITAYRETVPSNYLELALWLESDRMGFLLPALTQKKLDNQRDVVKNELRQGYLNIPYEKSWELLFKMMYPDDHPYSWLPLGSMEDLSAAALEDVSAFFKRFYTPNNASLVIAGDFYPETARKLVDKYFGTLPPGPPMERMTAWIPELDGLKRAVAEDNVELPRLYYAWHSPARYTPGEAELDLFADILGSGKTSRLQKALVYEQQIAQDVSVYQYPEEIGGLFLVVVTARKGHTQEELEKAVDAVLQKILTDGITKAELAQARIKKESQNVRDFQSLLSIAIRLNYYNVFLGDPGKLAWDMERYARATVEDVRRYARKYIDLNKRAILYIAPQGKLTAGDTMVDRTKEPSAMAEPAFTPPKIQRATLANGLEILLVENHRLPLMHLNLVLKSGFAADPTDRFGAAALTAELLDEGTKIRTALEITDEARRLGAEFGTGSGLDDSSISLNVLKKNLDPALDLVADIVLNPTFPDKELERQRQIYLGRIQQESKEPNSIANKAFWRVLYGSGHPYGQPSSGTESSLKAITRIDLINFYKANSVPGNAAAVIAGDITLPEAKQKLEKAFKKWEQGTVTARSVQTPPAPASTRIYLIDKPGAVQSTILIGNLAMRRSDPDYLPFLVMYNVFGVLRTSRINLNLREDKGYAYRLWSFIEVTRGVGPFMCWAPVDIKYTRESLTEMVREMRDLLGPRPLTDVELADSKNNLIKNFPQQFQDYTGIAGQLSDLIKYDLPLDEWDTYTKRVGAVTGAMANKAARDYLHPDALVIVIVGDREKIEDGIRSLNLGEIVHMDAVR